MLLLENLLFGWCPAIVALILVLGAGSRLLPASWLALPSLWPVALASVLGWHLAALLVFGLGVCGALRPGYLLAGFWLPLAALTAWAGRSGRLHSVFAFMLQSARIWHGAGYWKPVLVLCALFLMLLAGTATAPPSKHDDLHYHLLVAHRGLIEGSWAFHATPYLQAAPHTAYQEMLTPLLAVGLPSAAGVFSLSWGVLLLLLVVERARSISSSRANLVLAVLLLALGNAVWWVSPNPTAVSALWSSLLFLWLFDRDELCAPGGLDPTAYCAGAALLASALFLTKVSFLVPAGAALLVVLASPRAPRMIAGLAIVVVLLLTAGPWLFRCASQPAILWDSPG